MTTTASDPQIVPRPPAAAPALRAADQGVADALESVSIACYADFGRVSISFANE